MNDIKHDSCFELGRKAEDEVLDIPKADKVVFYTSYYETSTNAHFCCTLERCQLCHVTPI